MKIYLQEKQMKCDLELITLKNLKNLEKKYKKRLKDLNFSCKNNSIEIINNKIFLGLASKRQEDLKIAFCLLVRKIKKTKFKSLQIHKKALNFEAIVEGLSLGVYEFTKYKSKEVKKEVLEINIIVEPTDFSTLNIDLKKYKSIYKNVNMVRDIVNTSAEDFTPLSMSEKAIKLAKENSLECKVYGESYLLKNDMNAMHAVGRASRHESQLIHLTYKPKNSKGVIVFVGKGLTYDSGGLSLKSGAGMINMKCDKGGGSAVLGLMSCLKDLNYEYEVHGIIGAVENMIGGDAFKPGDILRAKNKTTIEVRNTDAEGRLVLADCLCYAQDEVKNIDYIFDIATLTGACITALGSYTTAVMGHSEKLKKKIFKASKDSGELVGELPFNRYLFPIIKSNIADITNSTGSAGGSSILASMFLDRFIKKENKNKWLHFDIAGSAFNEKGWAYHYPGASGASVRLLLKFIKNLK